MEPKYKKLLSMLLTAAMVLNLGLTPVFAAEGVTPPGVSGVCTHHTEHTEDCGYQQGTPCTHEHTDDCYTKELTCAITEDDTTGDAPEIATDSEADIDSDAVVDSGTAHTHGEDCYTKADNCKHTHDDTCGYTPDSPCRFDTTSCTQCSPGDKPAEKVCTCPTVDSGELVHGKDCPLYTTPELSEAVKALIGMVDALPRADAITDKNRESVRLTFDAALTAYEALSDDDKAAFEATGQYQKLMALHTALYHVAPMVNETEWDISKGTLTLTNACGTSCGGHTVTGTSTGGTISVTGGTITVSGGTISATGGVAGAGIGGGYKGAGGTITISDHAVVFTAKGTNAPNHIGEGFDGAPGTVNRNSGIIFEGTSGLLYGTSVTPTSSFTIPSTHLLRIESGKTLTISSGITAANNGTVINEGRISGTITGNQPVSPNLPTHDIGTGHLILDNTCSSGTCKGHTVTGTSTGGKIIVESGTHNVTLDNVTIDVSGTGNDCAFEITGGSTVNLTLTGTNVLKSGGNRAGLQVTEGNTLAITEASTGSLGATGGQYGAGIGGGDNGTGGTITVSGGTVNATGGQYGAGIGGGDNGAGGTITVSGGTVTATSGQYGAGIGGGNNGAGATLTVSGGTVTATGGTYSAGIGGGWKGAGGTITISDHAVVFTDKGTNAPNHIGEGSDGIPGTVNCNGGIIFEGTSGLLYGTSVTPTSSFTIPSTHLLRIESGKTLTINPDITVANNGTIINGGSISGTITGKQPIDPNTVDHDIGTGDLTLDNACGASCNHAISGTSTGGKIIVESGTHNVTLDNVTIDVRGTENACAFEITGGATVNLTLTGTNVLKSGGNRAGLQVTEGNTLAITEASTGSLGATGGNFSAGIGGGNNGAGGTITVSGGTVTATGDIYSAGIGGGSSGAGGTITISDHAVVFAAKGSDAPNHIGEGLSGAPGTVNRNGGILFEGTEGLLYGASVTPTSSFTIPSTHLLRIESEKILTINPDITVANNGTVINRGGISGTITGNHPIVPNSTTHDIGTGDFILDSTCRGGTCKGHTVTGTSTGGKIIVESGTHNITLDGVTIDVSGTESACAFKITGGSTVNLTLTGTNTLQSGDERAGLEVYSGNTLTITGADTDSLTATGGYNGTGMGGSNHVSGGPITISGGTISATGGTYSAGIGGPSGTGGTITVSGGTVNATGGDQGAGIGGGKTGTGGSITISGGTVNATGNSGGSGIGGGYMGAGGTVKIDGNTVVYAQKGTNAPNHIGEGLDGTPGTVTKAQGIIFEGESGKVYGDSVTLNTDTTIPAGKTLTIDNGTSFLISPDTTLTNNGTLNGTGVVSLLRASSRVDGSGTGNMTHVKKLLAEDTTTLANTSYGTPPAVTWDGVALTANTDYTASGITAGASVPVTVTGVGDYHGSVTKNIAVTGGGGGGGSGGSDGGGNTPIITPPDSTKPNPPTTAESNVNSKTDKNGNATATVADKDITNAIDKAQKEAKKNGTEKNGIAFTLNVKTDKNATALGVTLPQKSVSALIAADVTSVTVKNGLSTVTLDLATLKALASGDVILSISKADPTKLSTEAKAAIGNRPVFQFSLTSGGKTVSDFKGGRAGVQIPYTLTTTELVGNLCGVYVDANGKVNWLEASSYDPITGMMLISAQHFSTYGIGYKQSTPKFTDVGTHWAKNDIDFVVARGLLTGISNTTFAPETSMTRGMFVTALGRLAGVDTKKYSNTKFTDVAATAYYSPYVAWASANNIVTGTSDTTFSPDKAITRQEMAVMLVNYSKAIGYKLPSVHTEVSFVDAGSIASWAKNAVKQMQMAGILMGKSGNRFDPTATATRAEVSAMLRRYVELVVNTETAEGWSMNESGQWMYIQDGKRVTGNKTIDGKSYTFDQLGVTTALPPERKYLAYTVQAGDSFWAIARKYKVSMYELAKVNGKSIFSSIQPGDIIQVPQQ